MATLVLGGALRVVEVVYTQAEMAEAVQAAAENAAATASGGAGEGQPPTVQVGGELPVVVAPDKPGKPGAGAGKAAGKG